MKDVIVFDLDGTLGLMTEERLGFLERRDWDNFYKLCGTDIPNIPIIGIYKALWRSGKHIKIVTGRSDIVKDKTLKWLDRNGICVSYWDLHMRPHGDHRKDIELKKELVAPFANRILMVFEDRSAVVRMWRDMGICCLQVAEGDF